MAIRLTTICKKSGLMTSVEFICAYDLISQQDRGLVL
jgi:hypothetical protein